MNKFINLLAELFGPQILLSSPVKYLKKKKGDVTTAQQTVHLSSKGYTTKAKKYGARGN